MSGAITESWYRLFLRAFPPGHRAEYGAEMIDALPNGTARRAPSLRETAGPLTAGFAARTRAAIAAPWWADGLQPGLLMLALADQPAGERAGHRLLVDPHRAPARHDRDSMATPTPPRASPSAIAEPPDAQPPLTELIDIPEATRTPTLPQPVNRRSRL
ncbi:hypothetical protein [Actinomadura napierensis]|uniref:Uncharacterized protein n=1 Tax=Actinomadura napierensis TaxID=267854 RepID=A0ABP5JNK1_9ACTN